MTEDQERLQEECAMRIFVRNICKDHPAGPIDVESAVRFAWVAARVFATRKNLTGEEIDIYEEST